MICKLCEKEFEIKTNLSANRLYCYSCMPDKINRSEQLIILRRKMKRKLIEDNGGCCCLCGYDKYDGALEFHHIDSKEKEFTIGSSSMRNYEKMLEESRKCILLCSNCHKELHDKLLNTN